MKRIVLLYLLCMKITTVSYASHIDTVQPHDNRHQPPRVESRTFWNVCADDCEFCAAVCCRCVVPALKKTAQECTRNIIPCCRKATAAGCKATGSCCCKHKGRVAYSALALGAIYCCDAAVDMSHTSIDHMQ